MSSLVYNKKAKFNYEILETYSAGIELLGFEVKSLRKGGASLEGARVLVRGGEAYVVGLRIPPFQVGNTDKEYDPVRTRKLLMTKKEILELGKQSEGKRMPRHQELDWSIARQLKDTKQ